MFFCRLIFRLLALTWLLGGVYILISYHFAPGPFGIITALFGIPAGIGVLLRRRWYILPALLLCTSWTIIALILICFGTGWTFKHASLLIGSLSSGIATYMWQRIDFPIRFPSHITLELQKPTTPR